MAEMVLFQPRSGSWDEMTMRLPESLLAIAAVPVSKGYSVAIMDQRLSEDLEGEVDELVGPETRLFGFTAMTGQQITYALEITRMVKERHPHIPVCWGGVHATLVPEQTAAHPLIDYVVVGDGDLVFCELFERLRDGQSVDDLRGLVFKTDAGDVHSNVGQVEMNTVGTTGNNYTFVRKNGSADLIQKLDELPMFPYQLVEMDRYRSFQLEDARKTASLNTSRGCPFRCNFCSDPVLNEGKWRGFSAEEVLRRVEHLYGKCDVRMLYFQDDYFPGSKRRFIDVLKGLTKYNRNLGWSTSGIRADTLCKLSDEEWDLLYHSGCHSLEIGIESGNEEIIKYLNKAETLDEMREANRKLAQYDIMVKYTLIVGFPDETREQKFDSIHFAQELERDNPNCFCLIFNFQPIIGTPFYEDAKGHGFAEPQSLDEWGDMAFDTWAKSYQSWLKPEEVDENDAISFVSYFHNKNVMYKLCGTQFLRFCFWLYHPVAKWRFRNLYFKHCYELKFRDIILTFRETMRKRLGSVSAPIAKGGWKQVNDAAPIPRTAQT